VVCVTKFTPEHESHSSGVNPYVPRTTDGQT